MQKPDMLQRAGRATVDLQAESELLDALVFPRERLDAIVPIHERLEPAPKVDGRRVEYPVEPASEDAVVLVEGRLVVRQVLGERQGEAHSLHPALPPCERGGRRVRPAGSHRERGGIGREQRGKGASEETAGQGSDRAEPYQR